MRLQTQLTLAFTTLLFITMSILAVTIHSLLLDVLIQNERNQLQEKGKIIVQLYYSDFAPAGFGQWLTDEGLYMFIYDREREQIRYHQDSLDPELIKYWVKTYDLAQQEQPLWYDGETYYVVSIIRIYPNIVNQDLVLFTPLDDLQEVQQSFFNQLIIVFLVGILVIIILTHYFTHRMVTPLTQLKYQLKKVEKRQFDDIKRVKATGEIKEVEESVIEMARELQRYMKSQQQFLQNASHELKTPLMTIQGYAEGIRDGIFEAEESDQGLEIMVAEISRLKKIINEMILLAKLDSDENIYQVHSLYISELIQSTVDRALPMATDQQIALFHTVKQDAVIKIDQEKMLRAMMNIVTNAIRHAKTKVYIEVTQESGRLYITIDDDGEGIDDALMPHLFERFIKGKGGETGLGLAISRAIVERSNGVIRVDRSPMGGARFTIVLKI
ncbi:sensor histidine kinase [Amphibacillus sediminis]|uniref:sensor histidine kinase n=1 Tax=Amphibacillus sediminis TaxID=360185 RepID=UPI00082D7335|nr:HAMP domain-containing sensor histidine kinase [Amphibacillus sediminis]